MLLGLIDELGAFAAWREMRRLSRRFPLLSFLLVILTCTSSAWESKPASPWQSKPAGNSPLTKRIVSILRSEGAREAQWGMQVISLRRGANVLSWNQDKLFVPASAAKLFVTAAALARLGPEFRFKTTVEATGPIDENGRLHGDLVLVGRGDPNLSARVLPYSGRTQRTMQPTKILEEMAGQIFTHGVRAIDGDLVVDDTYFTHQPYGEDWTVGDLVWGFGAPVSALAVNDNVITLTVRPGQNAGDLARVQQQPLEEYFDMANRVVTVANGQQNFERISLDRRPGSRVLLLWGQIPAGHPDIVQSVAMDDPARFVGAFFRQELRRRGIEVRGALKVRHQEVFELPDLRGNVPPTQPGQSAPLDPSRDREEASAPLVLASHGSPPLIESIKIIHKVSQNLHAEMLLRTLGRERRQVGSTEAGLAEVSQFLKEMGVRDDHVALRDGSGLSRQTLASPSATVALLRSIYNSQYSSPWLDSLPVAGVDGSLAERLRGSVLEGRLHAKTGALAGVASLAGYIVIPRREPLAFAIYMNNANMSRSAATALIDEIAEAIARGR